jgi:hypothetical protein
MKLGAVLFSGLFLSAHVGSFGIDAQTTTVDSFPLFIETEPTLVSGIGDLVMLEDGVVIVGIDKEFDGYDSHGNQLFRLPGGGPILSHFSSNRYLALCAGSDDVTAWIYKKSDLGSRQKSIPRPVAQLQNQDRDYRLRAGIIVGDMMFFPDDQTKSMVAWELHPKGTSVFYDSDATAVWFNQHGESVGGLQPPVNPQTLDYFIGPTGSRGRQWTASQLSEVDISAGASLGIGNLSQENGWNLGRDRKGLIYRYTTEPGADFTDKYAREDSQLCLEIIDLWTKKAAFRLLGKREFSNPGGFQLSMAVGPDGSVEYTDYNKADSTLLLKRVTNDWWTELGLTNVQSAAVMDNRVRLRDNPSTDGQILGYLYDNDIVRIRAKSDHEDTIGGVKAYWYQVDHFDGRHGWVFGGFLDVQQ